MKNEFFKLFHKKLLFLLVIIIVADIVVAYISCNKQSVSPKEIGEYIELYQNDYSAFESKYNRCTDFSSDTCGQTDNSEYNCLLTVKEMSDYREQYKNNIASVLFQAEVNLSEGVSGTYSHRYQEQVKRVYETFSQSDLPMVYVSGWESYFSNNQQCLLMLIAVIILSSFVIINDYDVGMNAIIQTTKKGKMVIIVRKTAVTSLLISFFTIMLSVITIATIALKEGFSGGNAPLQCIKLFAYCPYHVSILGYALIQLLLRVCVFVAIGIFSILVSLLFKSYFATTLSVVLITLINTVTYTAQLESSSFTALFNGWLLIDANTLFSKLQCCNLFDFPVFLIPCIVIPFILGAFLCVFLMIRYQKHFVSDGRSIKITQWLQGRVSYRLSCRFPVQFELKKVFNSSLIILFCLSAVFMKCYITFNTIPDGNDDIYQIYTEKFFGVLTPEKETQISSIRCEIDNVLASKQTVINQYKSGEITDAEYRRYMTEYWDNYVRGEEFGKVEVYADELAEYGYKGWIIYDTGYNYFFELKPDLILCAVLYILSCGIFYNEKKLKMNQLNNATTKGKELLYCRKIKTCVILSAITSAVFIFIDMITVANKYPVSSMGAPIQSLRIFENLPFDITIGQFLIIFIVLKILFYIGFSLFAALLGLAVNNSITMITVTLFAVFLPDYIGVSIPAFQYLNALNYFSVTEIIRLIGESAVLLVGVPCAYVILIALLTLYGRKKFIAVEE